MTTTTLAPRTLLPRAITRTRWPETRARRTAVTAAATEHGQNPSIVPDHGPPPPAPRSRHQALAQAKPFSDFLTDTFARQHDYLRISITERCNLRCLYCMPEEGIDLSPPKTQLTSAEIFYLSQLFINQGVNKIRLTGGEPTVRKDIVPLMQQIGSLRREGLRELALTTNGISLHRKLDAMAEAGLTGVNISLDTLDPYQFQLLTRRPGFEAVMKSINQVLEMNKLGAGIKLKINCVVMRGLNDHQVLPFVEMTRNQDVEVRFIEYMPFGGNKWEEKKMMPYAEMVDSIRAQYPTLVRMRDAKNDTSKTWHVPGFAGRVGFITSMTHNFCGTCNRLRITSDGNLKVCLHGEAEVSLRDLLRTERNGEPMDQAAFEAVRQIELDRRKHVNGGPTDEGWISKERQLLDVIGGAVKRKKAKHAGIGELEKMKNRPMILIGDHRFARSSATSRTGDLFRNIAAPWHRVPPYLLSPRTSAPSSMRYYSSSSGERSESDAEDSASPPPKQQQGGSFANLGFQSLTGLFEQPGNGRYIRPEEPEKAVEPAPRSEADTARSDASESFVFPPSGFKMGQKIRVLGSSELFGDASEPASSAREAQADPVSDQLPIRAVGSGPEEGEDQRQLGRTAIRRNRTGSFSASPAYRKPRDKSLGDRVKRQRQRWPVPGPPFERTLDLKGDKRVDNPWGLGQDETGSEDRGDRSSLKTTLPSARQARTETPTVDDWQGTPFKAAETPINHDRQNSHGSTLTHLTSTGEAHMVDVRSKPATRRVAVAFGCVKFSNPVPARLISENSNKKGDVLGVARIAGIMAAKRTADIIPLCHPIPLSKIELDVRFHSADTKGTPRWWPNHAYGIVGVQALVETVGSTGVEMEALSAVSAATLTVYDMCKAVDRGAVITSMRIEYKSGGKSGLFARKKWTREVRRAFYEERGLEVPDPKAIKVERDGGGEDD